MDKKIEYVRYIHEFLTSKGDKRTSNIRDWLYQNSNYEDEIEMEDITRVFRVLNESYSDVLSYQEWIRDSKLDQLLD